LEVEVWAFKFIIINMIKLYFINQIQSKFKREKRTIL